METLEESRSKTHQNTPNARGLKGVHFDKNKKSFVAHINFKGTLMYLGNFLDKYEAYNAFVEASREHFEKYGYAPLPSCKAKRVAPKNFLDNYEAYNAFLEALYMDRHRH